MNRSALIRPLALRFAISMAGLVTILFFGLLYHFEPRFYYSALAFIGITPFRYPFLDLQFILAAIDCWQAGIDVYVHNPCDVLDRSFNYSPLWLRFSILPNKYWTNSSGLFLSALFVLALAFLPPARSAKELLLRLVATISPVTVFAVERGNIDILIFVLAAAAGIFLLRSFRMRVAAYTMFVVAALLKIFPLVLIVLTLRERPRVFFGLSGAAGAIVLATGLYFHKELVKMIPNVPRGAPFSVFFGAHLVPDLVAQKVQAKIHSWPMMIGLIELAAYVALFSATSIGVFLLVRWRGFRLALLRMPKPDKTFLLIGAALMSGCFLAGSNIGYRAIYLLFTLPGLLAMARMQRQSRVGRVAMSGVVLIVALTWAGFFTWHGLFPHVLATWVGQVAGAYTVRLLWLLSLIAWWLVFTLFIAILVSCFFQEAPIWRRLLARGRSAKGNGLADFSNVRII